MTAQAIAGTIASTAVLAGMVSRTIPSTHSKGKSLPATRPASAGIPGTLTRAWLTHNLQSPTAMTGTSLPLPVRVPTIGQLWPRGKR